MTTQPRSFDWARLLGSLGQGLMAAGSPQGWSAFGPAMLQAGQTYDASALNRRRFDLAEQEAQRAQEQWDQQRLANTEAAAHKKAIQDAITQMTTPTAPALNASRLGPGMMGTASASATSSAPGFGSPLHLSPEQLAWAQRNAAIDPEGTWKILSEQVLSQPKEQGPESTLGKLAADLRAGRINQAEYDAAVKKENYIAYPQGPGPTERERNAKLAGLVPGSQEYNDFILGRDVNSAKGPYPSNSPESTDMNNILRGQNDPAFRNSPEFIAAWNRQYEQPKIITTPDPNDPTRMVQMQITMPIPRGFQGPDYGTPAQAPGAVPPQGAASAPTGPQSATAAVVPGTSTIPQKEAVDLRKFESEADAMLSALDTFDKTIDGASQVDFLDALAGGFTAGGRKLSTDWANAALLSKAESLYNLGVLNGPDLDIIRNTLTDPSTIKGQFTSIDAYKTATKSIRKLITDRINTKRKGMNLSPRPDAGGDDYDTLYGLTPTE